MNKHVRAIHGAGGGGKRRRGAATEVFLKGGEGGEDEPSAAIRDLVKDDDLCDVVQRLYARDRVQYKADSDEEKTALKYMRDSRPGGAPSRRRGGPRGGKKPGSDSDEFDEGVSKRFPPDRTLEGYMTDPAGDTELPVMSRNRWQAKYIMAKAKLMLVEEENKMRRDELAFWTEYEDRVLGAAKGEGEKHDVDM